MHYTTQEENFLKQWIIKNPDEQVSYQYGHPDLQAYIEGRTTNAIYDKWRKTRIDLGLPPRVLHKTHLPSKIIINTKHQNNVQLSSPPDYLKELLWRDIGPHIVNLIDKETREVKEENKRLKEKLRAWTPIMEQIKKIKDPM